MMNETEICKWMIVGITVTILLFVGSCQLTNYQIVEAIEAGAEPLEAACALQTVSNSPSLCITVLHLNANK